jgi:crossover junction endodeoxyribonuclease RusA
MAETLAPFNAPPLPKTVRLTLPEPPSANRYWRHAKGNTYLSPDAVAYRETVWAEACKARVNKKMACDVIFSFRWFRSRKSGDLDNRVKQLLDSLQHGCVIVSDGQIAELHAYRDDSDKSNPRVELVITPILA